MTQVDGAITGLETLVGNSLSGAYFLDVGCGSGLSSLAAYKLGASRIVGFDYDPVSVTTCLSVKAQFAAEANWVVTGGSILDTEFVASLEPADVVYSWGVLTFTGDMWKAIDMTASLVKPNGLLAIAVYNQAPTSPMWLQVKKLYKRSHPLIRFLMVWALCLSRAAIRAIHLKHPFRVKRGMLIYYDALDWLGGLPYEYATPAQVHNFVQSLGFELVRENLTSRTGCNEFVFKRHNR